MTTIAPLSGNSYGVKVTVSGNQSSTGAARLAESNTEFSKLRGLEGVKQFDPAALPEDQYQAYMESERIYLELSQRHLEFLHMNLQEQASAPPSPRTEAYAKIVVGGKVVATIDNQGVVGTENSAIGDRINKLIMNGLAAESNLSGGPSTAQSRAERIAKLVGGEIAKANTALSQNEFEALPPNDGKPKIDYEAMEMDPMYSQLQSCRATYEALQDRRAAYTSASRASVA